MIASIRVHEEGASNIYTILEDDKKWIMQIQMNGEYSLEQQRAMLDKITKALQ